MFRAAGSIGEALLLPCHIRNGDQGAACLTVLPVVTLAMRLLQSFWVGLELSHWWWVPPLLLFTFPVVLAASAAHIAGRLAGAAAAPH